jgi:hypothetical protein
MREEWEINLSCGAVAVKRNYRDTRVALDRHDTAVALGVAVRQWSLDGSRYDSGRRTTPRAIYTLRPNFFSSSALEI